MTNLPHLIVYTDGSYKRGIPRCGYGIVFLTDECQLGAFYGYTDEKEYLDMWNVGGEIYAVLLVRDYILSQHWESPVDIYHDYIGISKWVSGSWKCNKEATKDYALKMKMLKKEIPIQFHSVRGHSGILYNEWADSLAKAGLSCEKRFNFADLSDCKKIGIDRCIKYQTVFSTDKAEELRIWHAK